MDLKKDRCVVIGSGQYCRFMINVIEETENVECIGYTSIDGKKSFEIKKYDCLGDDDFIYKNKDKFDSVFPAVGNLAIRKKIIQNLIKMDINVTSVIHPRSYQSSTSKISNSSLMSGSHLSNDVDIGKYSVIGTGTYVHHNTKIGMNTLVGGGSQIGASAIIGDNVLFGIGSVVASQKNINIGSNSIITSGAVVLNDIPENSMVMGNPARVIKNLNE